MSDDEDRDEVDSRLDGLYRDLPEPRSHGLFGAKRGKAQLRLIEGSGRGAGASREGSNEKPLMQAFSHLSSSLVQADAWRGLPGVPSVTRRIVDEARNTGENDPVRLSFNHLRTSLLKTLRSNAWNRVAIAAPTRGCGATFSALQLGLSLSGVPGSRTVLLDLNLYRPGLAAALGMSGTDMEGFLSGASGAGAHVKRADDAFAVAAASGPAPQASHLLHGENCALAIGKLMDDLTPDVLICDMPPVLENDDLLAFLPQVDGVLLVADGTRTLPQHIAECERRLEGQARILGVILNRARQTGPAPAYA